MRRLVSPMTGMFFFRFSGIEVGYETSYFLHRVNALAKQRAGMEMAREEGFMFLRV